MSGDDSDMTARLTNGIDQPSSSAPADINHPLLASGTPQHVVAPTVVD